MIHVLLNLSIYMLWPNVFGHIQHLIVVKNYFFVFLGADFEIFVKFSPIETPFFTKKWIQAWSKKSYAILHCSHSVFLLDQHVLEHIKLVFC